MSAPSWPRQAPDRLPSPFFAEHRFDIAQTLAIFCRCSPFNNRRGFPTYAIISMYIIGLLCLSRPFPSHF
jgi:hypothetical protein